MNAEIRAKLKKIDTVLDKVGYVIEPYGRAMYISRVKETDLGVESFIRLYLHKVSLGDGRFKVFFTCEPCKMMGGSNYMDLNLANNVCDYWKKMIKVATYLSEIELVGTSEEFFECLTDIVKRRRRQIGG